MRKFDYSFLNNGLLPANLVNLTANISALKTMAGVRKAEYAQVFTELEAVAKVQSIKSSNAVEGIVTSDERIAAIVNQNSAPLNHNEAEICRILPDVSPTTVEAVLGAMVKSGSIKKIGASKSTRYRKA